MDVAGRGLLPLEGMHFTEFVLTPESKLARDASVPNRAR